jgi:hypothetical protein
MESVTDQFSFFRTPSIQAGQERSCDSTKKKKAITKFTISLGHIEVLISIALLGGFITPLKASAMYIVWVFTSFGIVFGFSGLLSIVTAWCGFLPMYFAIIHLIFTVITLAFVCLAGYVAAILSNQKEWDEHIVMFIVIITIQGIISLTSLGIILKYLGIHCQKNTSLFMHHSMPIIDSQITVPDEAINGHLGAGTSVLEESNETQTTPMVCVIQNSIEAPGTPPPAYSEVQYNLLMRI